MAKKASFDITTGVDLQEVDNAVNMASKEIATRYDFKGASCTIEFDRAAAAVRLDATTHTGCRLCWECSARSSRAARCR